MPFDLLATQADALAAALRQPDRALALASAALAALLVLVSAFVRTMIPLRWLAVASNLGFIVYGIVQPNPLMLALHALLLPVNLWRVLQMVRITRRVRASADPQQVQLWLRPYMRSRRHRAGSVVFEAGDPADRMYLVADGEVELPEVGAHVGPGALFGEIAFFVPGGVRSSSARCTRATTLLSIDEATFRQLIHQHPEFGAEVLRLVAARLSRDVQRLQTAVAAARRAPVYTPAPEASPPTPTTGAP